MPDWTDPIPTASPGGKTTLVCAREHPCASKVIVLKKRFAGLKQKPPLFGMPLKHIYRTPRYLLLPTFASPILISFLYLDSIFITIIACIFVSRTGSASAGSSARQNRNARRCPQPSDRPRYTVYEEPLDLAPSI